MADCLSNIYTVLGSPSSKKSVSEQELGFQHLTSSSSLAVYYLISLKCSLKYNMNISTKIIIALCKMLWELKIWRLKLLKLVLTELSLGIIQLPVFRVHLALKKKKMYTVIELTSVSWELVGRGKGQFSLTAGALKDSWLSDRTTGRKRLKLFYISSLTASEKNVEENSPRIKGCNDCNILFSNNNRRSHIQHTKMNSSF